MFSIITPTFNRQNIISNSIDSSISFLNELNDNSEIVVIDDASTDGTEDFLKQKYRTFITNKKILFSRSNNNLGVTGAKNLGAKLANNKWLIFLDSDDELLPNSTRIINSVIKSNLTADAIFFRCLDSNNEFVGKKIDSSFNLKNINQFLIHGTYGECLPVIKKTIFLNYLYDEDLRGFEGLSYLRMLKDKVNIHISKFPTRKYSLIGTDRLSTKINLFKRSNYIFLGYLRYFKESHGYSSFYTKIFILKKIIKYSVLCIINYPLKKIFNI
tara:strand:- start:3729 stop:4541 length:813 start_codon:yes stop_codon:yes gene_type:complete